MYFGPGNAGAIDAMIGVGSADWPDILEAQSFNAEYGLYVSAPAGTSEAYPSHLGGFYITRNGLFKFYCVTDKNDPNFLVDLWPGNEGNYIAGIAPSKVILKSSDFGGSYKPTAADGKERQWLEIIGDEPGLTPSGSLRIEGMPTPIFNQLSRIDFDDPTAAYMTEECLSNLEGTHFEDKDGNKIFSIEQTADGYDFELLHIAEGAEDQDGNVTNVFDVRTFIGRVDDTKNGLGTGPFILDEILLNAPSGSVPKLIFELLTKGFVKFISTRTSTEMIFTIPLVINELFHNLIDCRDDVYAYFMQKSMTEKKTRIVLSDISYDKYLYDTVFPVFPGSLTGKDDPTKSTWENYKFKASDPQYVLFDYKADATPTDTKYEIGQLTSKKIGANTIYYYAKATDAFSTRFIACGALLDIDAGDKSIAGEVPLPKDNALKHRIFYVDGKSIKAVNTEEELISRLGEIDGKAAYVRALATNAVNATVAVKNPKFNTITINFGEEVYVGSMTSGGTLTGSLDENGKNTYGSPNFFPIILSDDDFSFVEVRVLQKFGDMDGDLDNGFWTNKRVLDPFSMDQYEGSQQSLTFDIEGDRWATIVQIMNLAERKLGCAWRDEWYEIVLHGLREALNPEYDDAWLFMECTGQDIFKTNIFDIRMKQKMATIISPKLLTLTGTGNTYTDAMAQKEVVFGRTTGTAQYAGEFLCYDPIAKKKYYRLPIGDVGCNLARIMDQKYGGWAPAWMNVTGELGGQLKGSCLRARYTFEDDATKTLDTKGINPIAFTSDDGMMILSQKTTQDPNNLTDWSFLGHSMSFDIVKREIRDNVMRPQVMKPINGYWMGIRQTQVDAILAKRTGGMQPIWSYAMCDIIGQQNKITRAERNFVIKVDVRVTPFSEKVTLIVENLAQE